MNHLSLKQPNDFFRPLSDIVETDKGLTFQVEIPGVPKENVNIVVEDRVLSLTAKAKEETKSKDGYSFWSRSFSRKFRIPDAFDINSIKADLDHGTLSLEIPRVEVTPQKQITVN